MHKRRVFSFVSLALAAILLTTGPNLAAQTSLAGDDVVSFLVRFGVTDTEATQWDGSLTVSNGELLGLRDWHPRPENEITGGSSWKLSTHKGINFRWRPWEKPPPAGPKPYYWSPGVVVDVKASAGTRLNVRTEQGRFSFNPRDVPAARPTAMLRGRVIVERVPAAELLSTDAYEDDFASMLSGDNGEVWVCWVAYRDWANEVMVRRFDGSRWHDPQTVTEQSGDVFLAKMGRDGDGRPWVVWSAQVDGNWDLYGRYLDGGSWSSTLRLTNAPQPDLFHNLATDSSGNLWLAWQGFRDGRSDIFVRRFGASEDGDAWTRAERLSTSQANDWEPVIATDSKGRAYVAWDTYDQGNYDVVMRRYDPANSGNGKSGEGEWGETIPVASTPKYEAHISLAVDGQDRLWTAWNESGVEWGKDTGFVLNTEGTRLYEWRTIGVAVYDGPGGGSGWRAPAADVNTSLPAEYQEYNDFPQLHTAPGGRVWLFARHRTLRQRDMQSETPAHRAAWEIWGSTLDGDRWTTPIHVPFTSNRQDVRWGLASDGRGSMFAAWPTDNRDFDQFLFNHSDVYAARLPLPEPAQAPKLVARSVPVISVFPMHENEKDDLARIRGYEIRSGRKSYRIYRGDTHRHSEFSMDGNNDGSLFQVYRYSIDAAELDYLLASEHNSSGGPDNDYPNWLLQQAVSLLTVEKSFVPFYGYERSISYPNGHRNILFAERGNPTLPISDEERRGEEGAAALYRYLKKYNGIAISHTSSTGMGTDWRDNDPEVEPLVEIYQGDRISAEYEGAPRAATRVNLNTAPGNFRPAGFVWNAWAKGYKLGVQAASDHLSTHISYACTIAEDFTREGMLDAMRKRHSYGATDNIILDYRLQANGKEYLQGDIVDVSGPFELSIKVRGTAPVRQLDIIKNQTFLHNRQHLEQDFSLTFVDNDPGMGEMFYYVRLVQDDGEIAWSSPIWINKQ